MEPSPPPCWPRFVKELPWVRLEHRTSLVAPLQSVLYIQYRLLDIKKFHNSVCSCCRDQSRSSPATNTPNHRVFDIWAASFQRTSLSSFYSQTRRIIFFSNLSSSLLFPLVYISSFSSIIVRQELLSHEQVRLGYKSINQSPRRRKYSLYQNQQTQVVQILP